MLRKVAENTKKPAYESLKFYQDLCKIRYLVSQICERFDRSRPKLTSQMRDAARSAKQNIREGYRRGSVREFIRAIQISQGSLEELTGDVEDCLEDHLITENEFQDLSRLLKSASYMMGRYLQSLYRIEKEGTWKMPGKSFQQPHVTSRNLV